MHFAPSRKRNRSFGFVALALLGMISMIALTCKEQPAASDSPATLEYAAPLQQGAYWPKFRRTTDNSGYSPVMPGSGQKDVWKFSTGKGIFSSPVIDKYGTIYIGSANKSFYALKPDGTPRWSKQLGELVDSSALIAADGTIYVGSGDGFLYAFDAEGLEKWRFRPQGGAYITWFEGNVTMGTDGTLYAGNDDYRVYAIDPDTGKEKWNVRTGDQIWSACAVGRDGLLYVGSNDLKIRAIDPSLAATVPKKDEFQGVKWTTATLGSIVASPLLTPTGQIVVGSFDSGVYALDAASGNSNWRFETRDHVYASAAQHPDGTLFVPSTDGTLYALNGDGSLKWAYDTLDPIRSSPAIGGDGTIYFGAGDGRLYAINADGTRRWSFDTSSGDRNDLNSSPALGEHAIYIAGEDGNLWSIPYDYCLRSEDARCNTNAGDDLPADGTHLLFLTTGGSAHEAPPEDIEASDSIGMRLLVRRAGETVHAAIDPDSVQIEMEPQVAHTVTVAANGAFLVVVPDLPLATGTPLSVTVSGTYRQVGNRLGNLVTSWKKGGTFNKTFSLHTRQQPNNALDLGPKANSVALFDIYRLAAPQPSLLPSYNQIGFDFMHLLMGILEYDPKTGRVLAWVTAAKEDQGKVSIDAGGEHRISFPMVGKASGNNVIFETHSFNVEFAQVNVPISYMRLGASFDTAATNQNRVSLFGRTVCKDVEFFGFLLQMAGLCNPLTDEMVIYGTTLINELDGGAKRPAGLTVETPLLTVASDGVDGAVKISLSGELPTTDHRIEILLVNKLTQEPYPLTYGANTTNQVDGDKIIGASLTFNRTHAIKPGTVEVIVLHDLYPVARFSL